MKAGWLIDAAARRSVLADYLDCPITDIKDRMCEGYPHYIRSFICNLPQGICPEGLRSIWYTAQILSGTTVCATDATTLYDFIEGAPERAPEHDREQDVAVSNDDGLKQFLDKTEAEHEVIDELDLDRRHIACGYENAPSDATFGIIYDRFSSDNQNETGCVSRVKAMLDEAADREVYLYCDPLVDVAESGKSVDRKYLKEMIRLIQHPQIEYLFLFDVSRLSRWNSFSIFLIDVLTRKLDVTVVTGDGPLDLNRLEGLAMTWVSGMSAEITNRNKARNTLGGQIEQFTDGNYTSWYKTIPIGYKESEENLLDLDGERLELAKAIFRTLKHAERHRAYKITREIINAHYSHLLDEDLTNDRIKRIIRNPVYIGKPTVEGESIGDQGQRAVIEKPELQIISDELFEEANEKANRIEEMYSSSTESGELLDLDYLLYEFGILPVLEGSEVVQVRCPECDSQMVRDHPYELANDERMAITYRCPACEEEAADDEDSTGSHRTFPNTHEVFQIKLLDYIKENLDQFAQHIDLEKI